MACVSIKSATCSFNGRVLFEEITLVIDENERVALIGPNGSGKSTLLKIIAKEHEPDLGDVTWQRGIKIAHVRQVDQFEAHFTVTSYLESKIEELDISEQQRRLSKILGLTGFIDPNQSVTTLSGGWKKRLSIAAAIIQNPDLLLLDEPTNHLDIDGILWLEEILSDFNGAIVFVSHDRYFIERISTRVVEINRRFPKGYLSIPGHYSDFLEGRENYLTQLKSQRESLANRVRREIEWLRQGAKARTTKSRARIKQAHELNEALNKFHVVENQVNAEFLNTSRKSKELIKLQHVAHSFTERQIIKDLSFVVTPGVRLGIVGSNGSGKTTLLKILKGELNPTKGKVSQINNVQIAYFDQHRASLDPNVTLHRALSPETNHVVFNGKEIHVSGWAMRFLLRADQLSTPVGMLSGGEQARVLVAQMMLQPCEVLMLDEPTNDLDIQTLEVLEEALCEFKGAVIIVSHDRFFLDRVCTDIIGLRGNGDTVHCASYTQWELQKNEWSDNAEKIEDIKEATSVRSKPAKFSYKDHRELSGIEDKILKAENRVAEINIQLSDPTNSSDSQKLVQLCDELAEAQREVERLYHRWAELDELKKSFE